MSEEERAGEVARGLRTPEIRYILGMRSGRFGMCRKSYRKTLVKRGIIAVQHRDEPAGKFVSWHFTPFGRLVAAALSEPRP